MPLVDGSVKEMFTAFMYSHYSLSKVVKQAPLLETSAIGACED